MKSEFKKNLTILTGSHSETLSANLLIFNSQIDLYFAMGIAIIKAPAIKNKPTPQPK